MVVTETRKETQIEEVRAKVREINAEITARGSLTLHDGKMREEVWTPPEILELMKQEFKRSDGQKLHLAILKFFNPTAAATWKLSEYDEEAGEFFGWCDLGLGFPEFGYVSAYELRQTRLHFGLWIERDLYYTPQTFDEITAE